MSKKVLWILAVALVLTGGVMAYGVMSSGEGRADCPGKIQCPLTGEWICRDRCPVQAEQARGASEPACCRKPQ